MIYLTSDHGGFALKNIIFNYLNDQGISVLDEGPSAMISEDDYIDYIEPVMKKIQQNPEDAAIVICRNGVGVSIAANKFKGIRAGLSWRADHAKSSRTDDDTNVLALPADYISSDEALKIVETWLNTPFSNEERHIRRINKIFSLETAQDGNTGNL